MYISREIFSEIKACNSYEDFRHKLNQNSDSPYFTGSTESNYENKPVTVDSGKLRNILANLLFFYYKEADGSYCSASTHFDMALVELSNLTGNPFSNDPLVKEAYLEINMLKP